VEEYHKHEINFLGIPSPKPSKEEKRRPRTHGPSDFAVESNVSLQRSAAITMSFKENWRPKHTLAAHLMEPNQPEFPRLSSLSYPSSGGFRHLPTPLIPTVP